MENITITSTKILPIENGIGVTFGNIISEIRKSWDKIKDLAFDEE